jgi:asparagine synthase (glutamine-hydrolysing)
MGSQAGVFYFDQRPIAPEDICAVTSRLFRGGACSANVYQDAGVLLANDLNEDEKLSSRGSYVPASFDGRLDNRSDLLKRLQGQLSPEKSNAELSLAACARWGNQGLTHLLGDWSLVLWHATKKAIVLASDFAGVRPLYYALQRDRLLWSTRLGPLVEHANAEEMDEQFIAGFLMFGSCPNRTPYRNIYSVPPGHSVRVTKSKVSVERFWTPPLDVRNENSSSCEEQLKALFEEAVRCRLPKTGRVLAELSGGLDSSSIVCMAADLIKRGKTATELVSLSLAHENSVDTPFYKAVELHCGIKGIHVSTNAFPFLCDCHPGQSSPEFWDRLHTHNATLARENGVSTYLTGLLGDLVMGNWWDDSEQVAGALRRGNIRSAVQESLAWSKSLRVPIYSVLWRGLISSLPARLSRKAIKTDSALNSSIDGALIKRTGLDAPEQFLSQVWRRAAPERRKHVRALLETLEQRRLQPPEPLQHLSYTHPYAHRPLVEFMLSIPPNVVCGPGEPRRLMRRTLQELWPPKLRTRRSKDTFGHVFLDSLRPLANALTKSSLEVVERGWVDQLHLKKRIERLSRPLDGDDTPQLQQIILLELWLRNRRSREVAGSESAEFRPW